MGSEGGVGRQGGVRQAQGMTGAGGGGGGGEETWGGGQTVGGVDETGVGCSLVQTGGNVPSDCTLLFFLGGGGVEGRGGVRSTTACVLCRPKTGALRGRVSNTNGL